MGVFRWSPPPPLRFAPVQVPRPEVLGRWGGAERTAGQWTDSSPVQRSEHVPEWLLKAWAGPRHRGRGQVEGGAQGQVKRQVCHGEEDPDALTHTGAGPQGAPTAHDS